MLYILRYRVAREHDDAVVSVGPLVYMSSPGTREEIEAEARYVRINVPGAQDLEIVEAEAGD